MKAIGIKINIQNYDANTFFGTNLPNGDVPDRRVRLDLDALRLGEPAHLLLVHRHAATAVRTGPTRPTPTWTS